MTKREWLRANGFPDTGERGRLSAEQNLALIGAKRQKVKFDDDAPEPVKPAKAPKTVVRAGVEVPVVKAVTPSSHIDVNWERRFQTVEGKKPVSNKQICYNCGVSLVGHNCANPTAIPDNGIEHVRVMEVK